uniref:Rapid alkalization factor-like peptide 3 n=1 Tax=Taraxacum kok-saghyz TaxID=333970 RepID=A0A513QBX8_TARKO|nr:rapid alkalization factor-like peptide 3 [Taraxacum kok-saghyz]
MAPSLLLYSQIALCLMSLALVRADVSVLNAGNDHSLHLVTDELDWPTSPMSMYDGIDEIDVGTDEDLSTAAAGRRFLFWKRFGYYISYAALSANRVPCPPRSGRSYYTHNCWKARGPVHPYSRGCSALTRCRR